MDIYYLNDCGIIRKANFVADLSYGSNGIVLTEELLYVHRTRIPCAQKRKYSYKIINTDNGRIIDQWEIEEDYGLNCINEDDFDKKHKEYLPESLIYAPYSMPYTNFALLVKGIIQPIATKEHKYRNTDFSC